MWEEPRVPCEPWPAAHGHFSSLPTSGECGPCGLVWSPLPAQMPFSARSCGGPWLILETRGPHHVVAMAPGLGWVGEALGMLGSVLGQGWGPACRAWGVGSSCWVHAWGRCARNSGRERGATALGSVPHEHMGSRSGVLVHQPPLCCCKGAQSVGLGQVGQGHWSPSGPARGLSSVDTRDRGPTHTSLLLSLGRRPQLGSRALLVAGRLLPALAFALRPCWRLSRPLPCLPRAISKCGVPRGNKNVSWQP